MIRIHSRVMITHTGDYKMNKNRAALIAALFAVKSKYAGGLRTIITI